MTSEQSHFWARLWEVAENLKHLTGEFELTFEDSKVTKKFPNLQQVYMHALIINLHKILGDGRSDRYRLSNASAYFTNVKLLSAIATLRENHAELITKIEKNRDWISAHTDPRLVNLKFSQKYVEAFERQFDIKAPELRSESKMAERYTPDDMKSDLPEIKGILTEVQKIWDSIIPLTLEDQNLNPKFP